VVIGLNLRLFYNIMDSMHIVLSTSNHA